MTTFHFIIKLIKIQTVKLINNINRMEKQFSSYPFDEQTVTKIVKILNKNPQAKKIVLQYPKKYLTQAFDLTKHLKRILNDKQSKQQKRQFYTLFDSMKKQCCTDLIGAQHINYDILIHFGEACFSQPIEKNHYYLFPTINRDQQQIFRASFSTKEFKESLKKNSIKYVMTEQRMYQYAKQYLNDTLEKANVELLRLPYDKKEDDEYLIFGYYANKPTQTTQTLNTTRNNILAIFFEHPQSDNKLLSDIHLTMGSFSSNKSLFSGTPQIFVSSIQVPQIEKSTVNYSKSLMQRLSLIGQLQKHEVFGLLVSNAGTGFCQKSVEKCKKLLEKHNKKYYVFMMNNLNQVKLGNFPQIQVYVIISCFNNSCFSMKDFYRLVVTPMDLEVAFDNVSISDYNFDLNHPRNIEIKNSEIELSQTKTQEKPIKDKNQNNLAVSVQQKQQIVLANILQTLDHYKHREYKGLDFSQKKPVQKIKKGKIGLAEQYKPLLDDSNSF